MQAVFVDLDSTLADTRQRWDFIDPANRDKTDWAAYSMLCENDVPVHSTILLCQMLSAAGFAIIILSARSEKSRELTIEWLLRYKVPFMDVLLWTEEYESDMPQDVYKVTRLLDWSFVNPEFEPCLVIDDSPTIHKAMEHLGVPCLLVNPGYFKMVPEGFDAHPESGDVQ